MQFLSSAAPALDELVEEGLGTSKRAKLGELFSDFAPDWTGFFTFLAENCLTDMI